MFEEFTMEIITYEEKEMIPLNNEEIKLSLMKSKKYATYAKKSFALLTMRKMNLNYTIKSEIIVITQENLEELHIIFAI